MFELSVVGETSSQLSVTAMTSCRQWADSIPSEPFRLMAFEAVLRRCLLVAALFAGTGYLRAGLTLGDTIFWMPPPWPITYGTRARS